MYPFNFTPKQAELLSTLFQPNKYVDLEKRKAIAEILNIPELVIRYYLHNKWLKEKFQQEDSNRCGIIQRNYVLLAILWENNVSNDCPTCSIDKEKHVSSNIKSETLPTYPDEVFQLFSFCNKNRLKFTQIIIPRQFRVINIHIDRAIHFYRQYHKYMAKLKVLDPRSTELKIFSEIFPELAAGEYFELLVEQMRRQYSGQANPVFRYPVIPIGLELPDYYTGDASFGNNSGQCMENNINNNPKEQVNQVCRNESASSMQKLPITINTFSAHLPSEIFEQQDNVVIKQEIDEVDEELYKEPVTMKSSNHGHHQSSHVLKSGNDVFRNENALKSPKDCPSSQSSSTVSNCVNQQQREHQTGQVYHVIQNERPTQESGSVQRKEIFGTSTEINLLTQFIKYCIIMKSESDQVNRNNSVLALPPHTLETPVSVPSVASCYNNRESVVNRVQISNHSFPPLHFTNLSNQHTMPLRGPTSASSGSQPLQRDRLQPSLQPSLLNQLWVFDKNRHSLTTNSHFPTADRVCNLTSNDVLASTQSNASQLSKSDMVFPPGYISNHAQPSVRGQFRPYINIAPNLVHPHTYNGGSVPTMFSPIRLEICASGQLHIFNQSQLSAPDRNKPYNNMKHGHGHPYNYNYNGQLHGWQSDPIQLQRYNSGQLYMRQQAQISVFDPNRPNNSVKYNHIHPYNYKGHGHSNIYPIPLEKYNSGQFYMREPPHVSVFDRANIRNNAKSNYIHPFNYKGNEHSKSDPIPLKKSNGGQLYIREQAQASVSNRDKPNNSVKHYHVHPSTYKRNDHSKIDPVPIEKYNSGQLYAREQAQASASYHNKFNNSNKSNHVHPSDHNSKENSKSDPITIDKYDGGQLYICEQAQPLEPERTKLKENMKSDLEPHNYYGSGHSMPTLISLDEYDGGRLYICDEAQPPVRNDNAPRISNGDQPGTSGILYPAASATDGVLKRHGSQYNNTDSNMSGKREYKKNDPPVKPLHVKIKAMSLDNVRARSSIESCNPTQRLKTQPRPLPHNRSVLKVEIKQEPEEKVPPQID